MITQLRFECMYNIWFIKWFAISEFNKNPLWRAKLCSLHLCRHRQLHSAEVRLASLYCFAFGSEISFRISLRSLFLRTTVPEVRKSASNQVKLLAELYRKHGTAWSQSDIISGEIRSSQILFHNFSRLLILLHVPHVLPVCPVRLRASKSRRNQIDAIQKDHFDCLSHLRPINDSLLHAAQWVLWAECVFLLLYFWIHPRHCQHVLSHDCLLWFKRC
jgi:hypothetical protein